MTPTLTFDRSAIASFCRAHGVTRLSLFGSAVSGQLRPESDIDVLVAFKLDRVPGFLELFAMEQELSQILGGRRVDLVTEKFLNPRIRAQVLMQAEVQYAEG